MSAAHKFSSPADAREFALAGRAILTLVSTRSGARFTYKVNQSEDGKLHFVSLLNGSDNTSDYSYLGLVRNGTYAHGRKSKIGQDAASARAFAWAWSKLSCEATDMPADLEVWHEGRCGRCARLLTVPESIARGLGPECAGKA